MADLRIDILFEATTVSNNYNDGQEEIHHAVAYTWKHFTGGFINSTSCDPKWFVGKGRGFDGAGGKAVPRTFTTIAYMDKGSAAHLLLESIGLDEFRDLLLKDRSFYLEKTLEKKGVTNLRLTVPADPEPRADYVSETGQFWGWMNEEHTHWRDFSGPFGNMIVPVKLLAPPMPSYRAVFSLRPKEGSKLEQEWIAERGEEVTV